MLEEFDYLFELYVVLAFKVTLVWLRVGWGAADCS